MSSDKKVQLDSDKCIGCGMCVNLSKMQDNDIFVWENESCAKVNSQPDSEEQINWVEKEVIPACPVDAIEIQED